MKKMLMHVLLVLMLCSLVLVLPAAAVTNGKIAFVSDRDVVTGEIYIMNADGSNPMRLTDNQVIDADPALSPDGTKIAFISNYEIYVMNADGSNPIRLTNNQVTDSEPTWSPDGMKIAFISSRDGILEIYVMNADGSNATRLTDNHIRDEHPTWSPDGMKIAFSSDRDNPGNAGFEIYAMNTDGSEQTRLTNNQVPDRQPDWSPDGTKIAFNSYRYSKDEIYVMNADGSEQRPLTNNTVTDSEPDWSPDGTKIAFMSNRDGNYEIYFMNADSSEQTRLTNSLAYDYHPTWGRVPPTNQPPVANAGQDQTVIVKEIVMFDGSGSTDSDGTIVNYAWQFGDSNTGSGEMTSHTYTAAGTYTLTLTATDNDGLTDSDTAVITVKTPAQFVQDLSNNVINLGLKSGIENGVNAKLTAAEKKITLKQYTPARNTLNAFINEVNAQRGKALTGTQADELIVIAQRIINSIPGK